LIIYDVFYLKDQFIFQLISKIITIHLISKAWESAAGAGGHVPLDFHTWYRDRGLIVLFFGIFCYFSVFFPLSPLPGKFFCRRTWLKDQLSTVIAGNTPILS